MMGYTTICAILLSSSLCLATVSDTIFLSMTDYVNGKIMYLNVEEVEGWIQKGIAHDTP